MAIHGHTWPKNKLSSSGPGEGQEGQSKLRSSSENLNLKDQDLTFAGLI